MQITLTRYSSEKTALTRSQGGTRSIHDGGSDLFFGGFKIYTLSIFFGLYIFWVYTSFREILVAISGSQNYSFEHFFSNMRFPEKNADNKSVLRYLSLVFFWVGNFDDKHFRLMYFVGSRYEAPSDSPIMYTTSTPWGLDTYF